jgi:hypothetical protein
MLPIPSHSVGKPQRVLLMVYDWCYAIDVYPDTSSDHPKPVDVRIIEERIREAVGDAQRRRGTGETAIPVGVLTADHRDKWAEVC